MSIRSSVGPRSRVLGPLLGNVFANFRLVLGS